MLLETQRLHLNEITFKDLELIHDLHSISKVDEFNTLGIPISISISDTKKILEGWIMSINSELKTRFVFSIIEKVSNKFIGLFGITMGKPRYNSAEIWYKLNPLFWNNGYATEATIEALNFCFNELKLHRIEAGCATENIGSINVLEKTGFVREGQKRKKLPIRGKWVDNYFYAILEEDHRS